MKIIKTLYHSDEVSGTYVADDGTKFHWTEGPCSGVIVQHPNGDTDDIPVDALDVWPDREIADALIKATENGVAEGREMTPQEEAEWTTAQA